MTCLREVWKFVSGKGGRMTETKTWQELFALVLGSLCVHTFLGASISELPTASDASEGRSCLELGRRSLLPVKPQTFVEPSKTLRKSFSQMS